MEETSNQLFMENWRRNKNNERNIELLKDGERQE